MKKQSLPFAVFFLKLSRNSSRSWDWLGGGSRPFWSLWNRSLSDQEVHRVPFVSGGRAIRVSPTLFSENRASICLRSRSDTASPFKVMISLPFLSPRTRKRNRERKKRQRLLRGRFGDKRKLQMQTVHFQGCRLLPSKKVPKMCLDANDNETHFCSLRARIRRNSLKMKQLESDSN